MTEPKVIIDEADDIFTESKRKSINNALVLTGGGTFQTFFSMGAVACLVDNGLFNFDLITGISGGTLLLTFLDLCSNPTYNYTLKPDWYNRYVRKSIYNLCKAKILPYICTVSGFDFSKLENYIFENIPDFNKKLENVNTNVICEYNYIDGNTRTMSCDLTDILDIKNNIKKPYWYIARTARCCLPFTNVYNKPTYDAGNICNIPVTTLFTRYNPNRTIIIKVYTRLIYDKYPSMSYYDLFEKWLFSNIDAADYSLNDMVDLAVKKNNNNIMCSISNSLNKSKDKYHKGLFNDVQADFEPLLRLYNGAFYFNEDVAKVLENEGYIQMYHQLKRTNEAKVFKIPNPDVYNHKVKQILENWKQQNVFVEFFKDIIDIHR